MAFIIEKRFIIQPFQMGQYTPRSSTQMVWGIIAKRGVW
jgi:hypothetical protein